MKNKSLISLSATIVIGIVNAVLIIFGIIYWNYQAASVSEFHTNSKNYLAELLTDEHNKQIEALINLLTIDLALISESLENSNIEQTTPLIKASLKRIQELKGVEVESSEELLFFYKQGDKIQKTTNLDETNLFIHDSISTKDIGIKSQKYFLRLYYTPIFATISSQSRFEESLKEFLRVEQEYRINSKKLDSFFISVFLVISFIISIFVFLVFKKLGSKIDYAHKQIESKNRDLQKALEELRLRQKQLIESEKMASLGELVAGISHEINTPVGVGVTATTKLISIHRKIKEQYESNELSEDDFVKYISKLDEGLTITLSNLQRAGELIKNFKQVAVDTESEKIRDFQLYDYLQNVIKSLKPTYKNKNISINIRGDRDIVLKSYAGAFSQLITNLIQNSIIHGFKNRGGDIEISISRLEGRVALTYKDNGEGISKENRDKIYDPFFTTNRNEGGSGLGLNIVYNIVTRKLNGQIRLEDSSQGVFFVIEIPI